MPATKQKKKKPSFASNNVRNVPKKTNDRGRPKGSKADNTKKSKQTNYKKQMWAIALFAIGVLIFFLTLIKGEYLWNDLRNIMFGLFSVIAFVIAPMIIYTAIMLSLERPFGSISGKLIQGFILVVLLCSLVHIIINGEIEGSNFFDKLVGLYTSSINFKSGGLVVALIGWPLIALFGKIPAAIIISVLIFVFALLLSGITLSGFFSLFSKPAKKIEQAYVSQLEAKQEIKAKSRFNIDVDIDSDIDAEPMPSHPVQVLTTDQSSNETKVKIDDIIKAFAPEDSKQTVGDSSGNDKSEDNAIGSGSDKKAFDENKQSKQPTNPDAPLLDPVKTESGIYRFPPLSLLKRSKPENHSNISRELEENAKKLVGTLKSFGVSATVTDISRGPSVTRYELQPSAGVKISKITGLADDIALNLAAAGVRIEAPIPNKAAIGIEVPNRTTSIVNISEILSSETFKHAKSKLTIALGKDIAGNIAVADINKMPHALIAGATGSGKSVCINSIIMSLLYKSSPNDVRLLLIDPKVVELSVYNGIPHLLVPVVTDPRKAAGALSWAVSEMLNRYKLFADKNVRDLNGYNRLAKQTEDMNCLPQIVIIIDELADLMMAAPNEVEDSICRLAQMARAAGMHLVIATQRPSVDVITGVIKANIPTRIAFAVSSQIDSRTILDGSGAEKLLGKGDMLFNPVGESKPVRIQGCFISDTEVESVITYINDTQSSDYDETIMEEIERMKVQEKGKKIDTSDGDESDDSDPMLYKAIECVVELGQASTSLLQRKLKLGYARAARIVDMMEDRGVVGPFEGSKPRKVLITKQQLIEMTMNNDSEN